MVNYRAIHKTDRRVQTLLWASITILVAMIITAFIVAPDHMIEMIVSGKL